MPKEQFAVEKDRLISDSAAPDTETLSSRYNRLAQEYENLYCNVAEAETYMTKYQQLHEGDPEKMLEIGKFFVRAGKMEKAD